MQKKKKNVQRFAVLHAATKHARKHNALFTCAAFHAAALAVSESALLLGREDGSIYRYTLPYISLQNRCVVRAISN